MHNAAGNGHIECIKLLIEGKAEVNCEDSAGSTPLHYAVRKGNKTCASFLIKSGANVNAHNDQMITPLHVAVRFPACVTLLLKQGAKYVFFLSIFLLFSFYNFEILSII